MVAYGETKWLEHVAEDVDQTFERVDDRKLS